ncbi:uncharacterized protein LY79DRAFT_245943 [Colletotrichum navitas]|uniref:Uncharacterized protein n=1 Tax=Colletotrichum navitas TaxID=681940 RepID=A0AAD8PYI4_9PEZI|nr:uncharacterized protein LY79DRAFT_245943 [Colletotrichum navitas]KAK1586068.1 hypothetical protein LY79DRAFT_245943 [Colletotrichum navitas]
MHGEQSPSTWGGYVCMKAQSGNQTGTALSDALGASHPSYHHPLRSIFVVGQGEGIYGHQITALQRLSDSAACPLSRPLPPSKPDPLPCPILTVRCDLPRAAVNAGSFPFAARLASNTFIPSPSPHIIFLLQSLGPLLSAMPRAMEEGGQRATKVRRRQRNALMCRLFDKRWGSHSEEIPSTRVLHMSMCSALLRLNPADEPPVVRNATIPRARPLFSFFFLFFAWYFMIHAEPVGPRRVP